MNKRLKILVSAYACSPYKGSEPGVGWGFVAELAKHHDLWVIVEEEKFRDDIERYLADFPDFAQHVHFHFIHKQRNRRLRKLWPPSYYWYYRRWHQQALQLAQQLHRQQQFDLAHQLTMVGFREPGYLWQLSIPFVWGPVGGMGYFPWRFLPGLGLYGMVYYLGYNLLNWLQMHFSSRPRQAARVAGKGLITATPENQQGAARIWHCPESTLMSEVGLPPISSTTPIRRKAGGPLKLVWTGQHTPGKALNLGLQAAAQLSANTNWELHILGRGPRTEEWKKLADTLGIADHCFFYGWLPREQAMYVMQQSHVMLITSLRDLTSTVTIEALALGLPIICLDHCGFAGVVDDSCGIKVPVTTPAESITGFTRAIAQLAGDESQRVQLAAGAIQRARDFSWENKIKVLNAIYQKKIAEIRGMDQ